MRSERLLLEPLRRDHAAALFPLLQDDRIYRFIPQDPPASPEALERRYRQLEGRLSPAGDEAWLNWAVRLRASLGYVGSVQATMQSDRTAWIAYELAPEFWGRGYATEAGSRVLELLYADYGATEVLAEVDTRNRASIRLLERLGFDRVGHKVAADHFKGSQSDEYTYRRVGTAEVAR